MAYRKPSNYDDLPIGGGSALTEGGHKCRIKLVSEEKSSTGKDMIVIQFDTADEDTQPHYYLDRYMNDARPDKKWGGKMYIVLNTEYTDANIKRLVTAVEDSNDGFNAWDPVTGELMYQAFAMQKVGIVFRGEEYTKADHTVGYSVKGFRFCNYDNAYDQQIPKRKEAPKPQTPEWPSTFEPIPDGLEDEGLPFK